MGIIASIRRIFRKRREIPDIPEDWIITGGEGVTVCVIDTGVPDHSALAGTIDAEGKRPAPRGLRNSVRLANGANPTNCASCCAVSLPPTGSATTTTHGSTPRYAPPLAQSPTRSRRPHPRK